MKKGAYSYLTKPFDCGDLLFQIEKSLEKRRLTFEIKGLKGLLEERYDFGNIVGRSEKMHRVLEVVSRIGKTDFTIYIHGESGTGKELIAKAVHLASGRKDKPFVAINCAALPETLLESELFGHEKGAFTGAIRSTRGLFSQAHEGTIFLDEIGDTPLSIQAKLLRALEERQFYPVGSDKPVQVDVRVIVATKKDLEDEVKKSLFREDLFYRIHVIPIYLPPLRERKEDIPYLADHFLKKISHQVKKDVKGLRPEAIQKLMLHDWPGNVRELINTLEYAVAMTKKDFITKDVFPQAKAPADNAARDFSLLTKVPAQGPLKPLKEAKREFEKGYLVHLLTRCEGSVSKAAKLAGRYRADFYDLLRKHEIKVENFKKSEEAV